MKLWVKIMLRLLSKAQTMEGNILIGTVDSGAKVINRSTRIIREFVLA